MKNALKNLSESAPEKSGKKNSGTSQNQKSEKPSKTKDSLLSLKNELAQAELDENHVRVRSLKKLIACLESRK